MISITILCAFLMTLTCIGSVTTNILLLLTLGFNQKLWKDTSSLLFNLCICDLILGLIVIPAGVHNSLFDKSCYSKQDIWCQFSAFLYVLLQFASVHLMSWVTIDKFAEIVLPLRYAQLFTKQRTWGLILSIWIYCIINASLPFVGLGQYKYEEHRYICVPSFSSSLKVYSVITIGIGVLVPITTVCVLSIYIVKIARRQKLRGTFECNDQHCYSVPAKGYLKSTIILVSTAVSLLICWTPYITISFYETFGERVPPLAEMVSIWLVLLTSALNPWLSSMIQKKYRNAMWEGWRKLKNRILRTEEYSLSSSVKDQSLRLRPQRNLHAPTETEPPGRIHQEAETFSN